MKKIEKKTPYHLQVYEILRNQILTGQIDYGEKIYENKVAQEIGVSRSPVREALRMLEQDELLVPCEQGLMVTPLDENTLREIYECRIALESYAARLSTPHITVEALNVMADATAKSRLAHQVQDYETVVTCNTIFHNTLASFCNNRSLQKMIQKYSDLFSLSRIHIFKQLKRSEEPYLTEHSQIIEALKERDENLVEHLMRRHIEGDYVIHSHLQNL